jgi:WD40 repeat protein
VFCTHAFSAAFVALGEHAEDGKERIVLYDIESGKPSPTHIYHIKWIRGAVFSSDGSLLVTTGNDGFIRVYDINQNKFEWEHINDPDGAFAVSMHPNSDYIAVGCMRGIRIWSLKERRLVSSWRGHSWFVDCMTFSRDGKYLLSGSPDDTAALWRTTDVIGKFEYGKD